MNNPSSKLISLISVLFVFLSITSFARAEEEKTEISSDILEHEKDSGAYFLKGNVEIRKGDVVLKADESYFDEKTSDALLKGGVTYEDKDMLIRSDSAELNLDAKTGRIHNSYMFIKEDNYHIKAEEVERKSEDRYSLINARVTTCDAPVPAWCFRTADADILLGDSLKAKSVVFEVKGVPVLYTPYLWTSLLTERKTGFLFPEVGYEGDLGVFYKQPFFIVLSENRDATLRLDYYHERGLGKGLEYRYIERGGISGSWWGYHLRDDELEKDFYYVRAHHNQRKRTGISHFLSINYLDGHDFFQEYSDEVETRVQRFLESSGSVYYSTRFLRYYASSQYWQDLRFSDGDISQDIPTVGISLHPLNAGPFLFSLNTEATSFPSSDSQDVQRYSVTPELSATFGNTVRLHQTLKYNAASYRITHTDAYPSSTERSTTDYDIGVITSTFKRYSTFTHTIEPELSYNYVTNSDYDAPLLDAQEAVDDRSDIIFTLHNDLVSNKSMVFSFRLSQAFGLEEDDRPWRRLEGDLYLSHHPYTLNLETFYDHYTEDVRILNSSAGMKFDRIKISAGNRYDKDNNIEFYTGGLGFYITKNLFLDNSIWYDTKARDEKLRDFKSTATYSAQCWSLTVSYNKTPDDYGISFLLTLKGLGEFVSGSI